VSLHTLFTEQNDKSIEQQREQQNQSKITRAYSNGENNRTRAK